MSDLPPNIDAILASIRSRMTESGTALDPPVLPPFPTAPAESVPSVTVPEPVVPDFKEVSLEGAQMTLDGLLRSLLEPAIKTWLDAHAPEIVEKLAQSEIRRLTRGE